MSNSVSTYKSRKARGLCVKCGKTPALPGKVCCFACAVKAAESSKARYEKLKAEGKCITCGKPVKANEIRCFECAVRWSANQHEYRARGKGVDE